VRFAKFKLVVLALLCPIIGFNQSHEKIDSLQLSLLNVTGSKDKTEILLSLSDQLINNSPDEALKYALEANALAKESENTAAIAKSANQLSVIYRQKIDLAKAIEYANEALEVSEENNIRDVQCHAMINLGYIYNKLGDYNTSSGYFFSCLKLSEEIDDKTLIAMSLNSIGYTYFDQENFDKALEYYLKSLGISREINDKTGISAGLNNLAAVYGQTGEIEKMKTYVMDAIKINKKINQFKYLTINYVNMGFYFQEKDNYDSSMYYYYKALELAVDMENHDLILNIKINVAKYMYQKGKVNESLDFTKEILKTAKIYQLKKNMHAASMLLADIYESKSDYKNAFVYSNLRYQLKDSLELDSKLTELSKLELLYDIEKKRQVEKMKQQRQQFIFIIATLLLVFLTGYVLLLLKRHRLRSKVAKLKQQKLEDELEFKKKELTTMIMSLMKKNEMLAAFSNRLLDIEKKAVKEETKSAISNMSRELHRSVETEIWEDFELRFKEVHFHFYNKLIHTFPDLSPNEQRLCAFLKLNMSTKEISELTGQSSKALEMARYRLRIKLNISGTDENLIAFLSQI
jgi:tetratricopeptide (TPR) repeat protein